MSLLCLQTVQTILTVLRLQQFLEVLLGLLLHYRLTGANICKWRQVSARASRLMLKFINVPPVQQILTQAQQPVLLLQAFQFLRHKRLHLLDVHPLTLLHQHKENQSGFNIFNK